MNIDQYCHVPSPSATSIVTRLTSNTSAAIGAAPPLCPIAADAIRYTPGLRISTISKMRNMANHSDKFTNLS